MRSKVTILFFAITFIMQTVSAQTINLFNGKDLSGWKSWTTDNSKEVFTVRDGKIHCAGNPMGFLYTEKTYDNFKLHVEWRWDGEPSNSGIFIFMQPEMKCWPNAVEVQLCAGEAGNFVLLGGSDVQEFKVKDGEKRPAFPVVNGNQTGIENIAGEWNVADITVKDGTLTVYINGTLQNYGSKSMHKSGHIGLQSEGKNIEFRNIKLTEGI